MQYLNFVSKKVFFSAVTIYGLHSFFFINNSIFDFRPKSCLAVQWKTPQKVV